jgi:tetratricopeptide (TPR) repeat protein
MAKKKIARKKLKQPDEFITLTGKVIQWGQKHVKEIGFIAMALVGILLAIVGYRYFDNQKEIRGFALLNQTRAKYATEVKKSDAPEKVYEAVRGDYQKIIDDFSGRGAGRIARKKLADICFDAKVYDRAIELYEKSLVDFKKEPFYRAVILNDLAYACEANKNDEAAIRYFKEIIEMPDALSKDQALFHLAGFYEKQGNADKARELYEKINAEYAESIYIDIIKEKIAG